MLFINVFIIIIIIIIIMIKVLSDTVSDMDSRHVVFVVPLDISAAFDTVDHKILVDRLENRNANFWNC